jgi:hypothetical protein
LAPLENLDEKMEWERRPASGDGLIVGLTPSIDIDFEGDRDVLAAPPGYDARVNGAQIAVRPARGRHPRRPRFRS